MEELISVVEVRYVHDHVVWLRFSDGRTGEVDLRERLRGRVFEPLKDIAIFSQVRVDPEIQTIAWPNGADIAPESLYALCVRQVAA